MMDNLSRTMSNEMDFTLSLQVRLDRLQFWRASIEKSLNRAKSLVTFTDLVQSVILGNRVMFDNGQSYALIQPDPNPSGLGYFIYCAGGDYTALCELEKLIVGYARSMGAVRLSTIGRNGFLRRLRPSGWEPTNQVYFVKNLEE